MIDDKISLIAESFFPEYYKESGPNLVAFIKSYVEWLEQSNNVLYYARSHVSNKDIDVTLDQFLIYFKNKFLPNIQLSTELATKELVKQSLPFYRSRGTDLSFDLFFKAVFGVEVSIYRPYEDVFKLSSGLFKRDNYIELDPIYNNFSLIGKEITGLKSGSVAYVDSVVRKNSNSRLVDIAFISSIKGSFKESEAISFDGQTSASKISGSIDNLIPYSSDSGFSVGDEISFVSDTGIDGIGYVSNVSSINGLVNFSLIDGGWGYSSNVNVYVSNVVTTFANVSRPVSAYETIAPVLFANVTQSLQNITYTGANNYFSNGDVISVYSGANASLGSATILTMSNVTSNSGFLVVSQFQGNIHANTIFYNQGNLVSATINVFSDVSVTAENLNVPNTISVTTPSTNTFAIGENVYQIDALGRPINGFIQSSFTTGTNTIYSVVNCSTLFFTNTNLYSYSSNTQANVLSLSFTLGLYGNSSFVTYANNFCSSNILFSGGTLAFLYGGNSVIFSVPTNRTNVETANVAISSLTSVANVALNVADYGVTLNHANSSYLTLDQALVYASINIGTIQLLSSFNPGNNYVASPYVLIVDPFISSFQKQDYTLKISNATGIFQQGEIIIQNTTGAKGLVRFANSSFVSIERMNFKDLWTTSYVAVGQQSNYQANVTLVTTNTASSFSGENATVGANVVLANGVVTGIVVETSGIGFSRSILVNGVQEDFVTFYSSDKTRSGQAFGVISGQGKSKGYYASQDGFLSSTKKLTDSYYYQPFAYEIQTSIMPSQYKNALKKILHTAGKVYFSSLNRTDVISSTISAQSSLMLSNAVYIPHLDFSSANNSGYLGFF